MQNLVLLFVCFLAGVLLQSLKRLPSETPAVLNGFIIHISLPALTLLYLHDLKLSAGVFALLFFPLLGRLLHLPRMTVGALILTGGLGNTSFVGLPMIEAYFGREALVHGILVDQLGSFMVLSTLGIVTAGVYSNGKPAAGEILQRIVTFPPFLAMAAAVLLMPFDYPEWFRLLLGRLGDTLAPLALLSVGYQLHPGHLSGNIRNLALGLSFKLLRAPLLLCLLYPGIFGLHGLPVRVTLFEAAMPPMITAGIIAAEHGINPSLASMMVAVGIMASFFTLALWSFLLRGVWLSAEA
ncbi:MAG: AEC family transporter [Chlorobi bacterium]|nr:AEC family transporter [Chlorobiota bacterium]